MVKQQKVRPLIEGIIPFLKFVSFLNVVQSVFNTGKLPVETTTGKNLWSMGYSPMSCRLGHSDWAEKQTVFETSVETGDWTSSVYEISHCNQSKLYLG